MHFVLPCFVLPWQDGNVKFGFHGDRPPMAIADKHGTKSVGIFFFSLRHLLRTYIVHSTDLSN